MSEQLVPGGDGIVAKGHFARLLGVTPARVSQYLRDRQIHGAAIVGTGRNAKIQVSVAREQLRRHLDSGQMVGNGLDTRLSDDVPAGTGGTDSEVSAGVREPTVEDRLKSARLSEQEMRNRRLAEEERARRGTYMRAEDARAEYAKIAARTLDVVDGGLAEIASALSAQFEIPNRDVLHALRQSMRKLRSDAAEALRRQATALPDQVDDLDLVEDGER